MNNLYNPFVIGKYVNSEFFCDRVQETDLLSHHIYNGRNLVIMSERRLGKTGLIEHAFATRFPRDKFYTFQIDIYTAKNLKEFVCLLANEIFRTFARKESMLSKLSRFVQSLKTVVTYNSITGEPEVKLGLGAIEKPEITLDELFSYLESSDLPCIVAIDEFQKITEFEEDNMEELLRTKIQHLKNTQFVFAGSEKHLLEGIFNDPKRPFYNSVVFMQLLPIEREAYIEFCQRLFRERGRNVSRELVCQLYDYFKGVTWYLQLSMNEAFATTDKGATLKDDSFDTILHHMVDTKRFTFEDRYSSLTEKQKSVVQAIAMEYPKQTLPTSREFITKYNLKTSSSVQTALKGLADKGILKDYNGQKEISDILFLLWLKKF